MRRTITCAALAIALTAAPALAAKVYIDYDTEADLESLRRLGYVE